MTTRALRFTPSGRDLADAKATADAAYRRARASGGSSPAIVDKLWADTLTLVERQRPETASEMYRRTQHLQAGRGARCVRARRDAIGAVEGLDAMRFGGRGGVPPRSWQGGTPGFARPFLRRNT
jgi:hypothetical protein